MYIILSEVQTIRENYHANPDFYSAMVHLNADVNELYIQQICVPARQHPYLRHHLSRLRDMLYHERSRKFIDAETLEFYLPEKSLLKTLEHYRR